MQSWISYAIIATITGGIALVFAKMGMRDANESLALVIRTGVLFMIVLLAAVINNGFKEIRQVPTRAWLWFAAAGLTTGIYWISYFKAMRTANVSVLAIIDKGGIIVTFLLSYYLLSKPLTPRLWAATILILSGTLLLIWK
ncbi:MAG: EamA family transporter [Saprospiraceae bacterium]